MKRRNLNTIILLIIIVLPVLLAVFLSRGKAEYNYLPVLGPKTVDQNGDTIYHQIPEFSFFNQSGERFVSDHSDNYIWIADFIFTRCPLECPVMTENMRRVQQHFRDLENIRFISITVDPEYDRPDTLKAFAEKFTADLSNWSFLTGDKKDIYELATKGFFLSALKGDGGPDDFIHSEMFVLVDKDRRIRGYFDGTSESDIKALKEDVLVLDYEYKKF